MRMGGGETACEQDVAFAVDALGTKCAALIEQKAIDWKKVGAEMKAAAKLAKDDSEHLLVLVRLLARLRDGHAEVRPLPPAGDVTLPASYLVERAGPGLFFCRVGDRIVVKNAWSNAEKAGVKPGMEVVKLDGKPASEWMKRRVAEISDVTSFSTDAQAWFFACHWGLALPKGTKLELELKDLKGKKLTRSVLCEDASQVAQGPAFPPPDLERSKDLYYGRSVAGWDYVHVRRSPSDLPEQMDAALQGLAAAKKEPKEDGKQGGKAAPRERKPGLILDFRGNSGGSFDHDAFMGRFVPKGTTLRFGKVYASAGPEPYAGRIVVIIDATIRSAGETAAGIFKEDGRAYVIGESNTAGMSSSKEELALPSGKFALYVSVESNKGRFNGGKGIEGIGIVPHELVAFDPKDLDRGVDTLIARAEALLAQFPDAKVPYSPPRDVTGR